MLNNLMQKTAATIFGAAVLFILGIGIAYANPTFFGIGAQTNTATSSPKWMSPGSATSTVYWDVYQTQGGVKTSPNFATLLVQFSASNTNSRLNITLEFADDVAGVNCATNPNACDWYRNYVSSPLQFGTTTPSVTVGNPYAISWPFASSTLGAATTTDAVRSTAAISIPTPTRYVRAVFTITGANGAVWARFAPILEYR